MDNAFKTSFGQALKWHRKQKHLSQERLGLMVGVSRLTIRRIEHGVANPTLNVLLKLSDGLEIPLHALMEEADNMLANSSS